MATLSLHLLLSALCTLSAATYIPSGRVTRCSRVCPCYYQSLFCRNYNLPTLPVDLAQDVQNIDFQDNKLRELTNETLFPFTRLRKLLLGNNNISRISRQTFSQQRMLNALDLSSNRLSEITGEVFDPIRKKLEHLTLQDNDLYRVEGLFEKMRVLKTLNLKDNNVWDVSAETFFQNRKLRYLQLANNKIKRISPDSFKRQVDLQYLFLDSNHFVNLTELRLTSKKLQSLSLSNCSLRVIPKGIARSLQQLNMAENQLEVLDIEDLSTLRNLGSLDLSRNLLSEIGHRTFRHLSKLKVLYLGGNKLREVPRKLPENLEQLQLDHNLISHVSKDVFSKVPRLSRLTLNNNMIEYVHKKALSNLEELKVLDLSSNLISRLSSDMFEDLARLVELDVSNNPIIAIESGAMDGLWSLDSLRMDNLGHNIASGARLKGAVLPDSPRLRILSLSNSHALTKSILTSDLTMYHLRSVEYLNLMQNNLRELPATFPQFLPNLQRIQLSNNPWTCSRDLYWLRVWLLSGIIESPDLSHIYCDEPSHLQGRQLIDLDTYDWVSSDGR